MKHKFIGFLAIALSLIVLSGCAELKPSAVTAQPSAQQVAPTPDYSDVTPPPYEKHQTYDATLPPASSDTVKQITLHVQDKVTDIAPDVPVDLWTFDGSVPGPILHVNQGDTIKFTLVNSGTIAHSIDFHAAQTPWNINYQSIGPGESLSFDFKANYSGVFVYHCGTPPVLHHIANGMYGAIVVSSPDLKPVSKEYVLLQSEFYVTKGADGLYHTDSTKALAVRPDYVVFNGYADQYKEAPLTADPDQRIRIWVANIGPTTFSAFHIIGTIFDTAYPNGNPQNVEHGMQTVTVPPGGGYMVELTVPDAGLYPIVTHAFAYTGLGALGLLKVGDGGATSDTNTNVASAAH